MASVVYQLSLEDSFAQLLFLGGLWLRELFLDGYSVQELFPDDPAVSRQFCPSLPGRRGGPPREARPRLGPHPGGKSCLRIV